MLLEVVQHGHGLLPAWRAIDAGVVPLLVVLTVHAARILARGAVGGGFGVCWRLGGGEMREERIQKEPVRNLMARGAGGGERVRVGVQQMAVTICHLRVTLRLM